MNLQERFGALEVEAKGRIRRALSTGNEKLLELDEALARVAQRDDRWVTGVRKQIEQLKARAEKLRASAVKRASEIPGEAVSRLATGSRAPVQNLARGFAEIAKRFEASPPRPVVVAEPQDSEVAKAS